jgi:hypothetical protein
MVLAFGLLLFGSAFALAFQAEPARPTPKPEKPTHKSDKPITKAGKLAHSAPTSAAKALPAASRRGVSRQTAKSIPTRSAISPRATAHQSAHRLPRSAFPSRTANGRYASSPSRSTRDERSQIATSRSSRRYSQPRAAALTSRSRLRASLRDPAPDLPQSSAPVTEDVAFHRRGLGLASLLRGSRASLERQDEISEGEDGLERIQDEDDLQDRIAHNFLVPVPTSTDLTINQNLPETHRYCRPWTAQFLSDLAHQHSARFHSSLEVSSAVRTVEYQKQLERVNGNAAAAEGDIASPHLTGATIDIAKGNMTRDEIAWMRTSLLALQQAGKLDVEEEFKQSCFHITVYRSYAAAPVTTPLTTEAVNLPAVNLADEPALPIGRSAAPLNAPVIAPAVARTHARSRHSKRTIARAAKPLPA